MAEILKFPARSPAGSLPVLNIDASALLYITRNELDTYLHRTAQNSPEDLSMALALINLVANMMATKLPRALQQQAMLRDVLALYAHFPMADLAVTMSDLGKAT